MLCCSIKTVSADVIHPLHAKQSWSDTFTGSDLDKADAWLKSGFSSFLDCICTKPSSSNACGDDFLREFRDTTHACDGDIKSLCLPTFTEKFALIALPPPLSLSLLAFPTPKRQRIPLLAALLLFAKSIFRKLILNLLFFDSLQVLLKLLKLQKSRILPLLLLYNSSASPLLQQQRQRNRSLCAPRMRYKP